MYYFIVNPTAGSGRGKRIWEEVRKELDRLRVDYHAFLLRSRGEARKIASSLSVLERDFTVVVVGGDGTLNEVIDGLSTFRHATLGCIPTGSGNDFVRGLGLPRDPAEALNRILKPNAITPIRIGSVSSPDPDDTNGLRTSSFAVSSGIGFDAAVCYGANRSGLKNVLNWFHLGKLVYTGTALYQLAASSPGAMSICLDDMEPLLFDRVIFAASMNLPYEGGGFHFAPMADPASDRFYLCAAEGISKPRILSILPLAFSGRHVGKRGIHLIPFKKAVIHSESPLCVHTDGEIFGFCTDLTIRSRDELLRIICR